MQQVTVIAPAKLNLSLDIVGLLPKGYHALDMVMQAITLYETVELKKAQTISLQLPGSAIEADESNTAFKAARLFFEQTKLSGGAEMIVHKKIPAQAGMAGGSADAAAVLVGLNRLYEEPLSMSQLLHLAGKVGADVPFSLMGGTCRVQGTGDFLKALPDCPACWFVVMMPEDGVSTPAAFARFDKMGSPLRPNVAAMENAICAGNLEAMCEAAGNALQPCSGTGETELLCALLRQNGAMTALMTGSGAAVFGVYREENTARAAAEQLKKVCRRVYLTQPDTFGARVVRNAEMIG